MSGSYHSIWLALGSQDGTTRVYTPASLNASVSSTANLFTGMCLNASCTFTVESGTPTGTFVVQQTNDPRAGDPQTQAIAKWNTIQSIAVTAGAFPGGGSSALVSWINGARFTQITWTNSSGTGTGYAFVTGISA